MQFKLRFSFIPILLATLLSSNAAASESFNECPARAFLSQNTQAHLFDVNLVTGHYSLLSNQMGAERINGIGFSTHDRYFYAWSYLHGRLARIGTDYQIVPLDMTNIASTNFYVGDVSVEENAHYVYKRGSQYGLYRISLDADAADYLQMTRIVSGSTLNLNIFDMAFHPTDGSAYAVDNRGKLWRIDVYSGSATNIADMGETGTFGAAYFDVDGRFYFSRNSDGHIFRVDIDGGNLQPQLFAYGPSSSTNDGARCVLADIVDESVTNVDYGDAPDSYQTSLGSNGPRHEIPEPLVLFLGSGIDGESNAAPYPLSDDSIDANDDEDGVSFPTGLLPGYTSILLVDASATGNLNAWVDTDRSGTFETDEQTLEDRIVNAGTNVVAMPMPEDAEVGATWARFRLSSASGLDFFGGAPDGEVEDQQVTITAADESSTWYPSASSWTTIAFEDNWPKAGDYDMNDLVVRMRTAVVRNQDDLVTAAFIEGHVAAVGAAYQNGFAIRLPGIDRAAINTQAIDLVINDNVIGTPVLDPATDDATFIVANNVYDYVSPGEGCQFHHTEPGCGGDIEMWFRLLIPLTTPVASDLSGAFDPFLFATPGAWHGDLFTTGPGRSYEIHLKNFAPTSAMDMSLFGQEDDASDPSQGMYYQSANGMPWALEIPVEWAYPKEFNDLLWGYPQFEGFVESDGAQNPQWFLLENADPGFLFDANLQPNNQ